MFVYRQQTVMDILGSRLWLDAIFVVDIYFLNILLSAIAVNCILICLLVHLIYYDFVELGLAL